MRLTNKPNRPPVQRVEVTDESRPAGGHKGEAKMLCELPLQASGNLGGLLHLVGEVCAFVNLASPDLNSSRSARAPAIETYRAETPPLLDARPIAGAEAPAGGAEPGGVGVSVGLSRLSDCCTRMPSIRRLESDAGRTTDGQDYGVPNKWQDWPEREKGGGVSELGWAHGGRLAVGGASPAHVKTKRNTLPRPSVSKAIV